MFAPMILRKKNIRKFLTEAKCLKRKFLQKSLSQSKCFIHSTLRIFLFFYLFTFIHFCLIFGVVSESDLEHRLRVITH